MGRRVNTLILAAAPFGDAALAVGPMAARRAMAPDERVTIATHPGAGDLLRALDLVDDVWETGQDGAAPPEVVGAYRSVSMFIRAARTKFQHVIDLFPSVQTRALSLVASSGKKTNSTMKYLDALLKGRSAGLGLADPISTFALALGVDPGFEQPHLEVDAESDVWIERALASTGYSGGPIVVVHSSGRWPHDRFVEVGERLRRTFSVMPVVLDSPRSQNDARTIANALGGSVLGVSAPLAGRFLSALARSSVVVSDDVGTSYVASLLGAPSVHIVVGKSTRLDETPGRKVMASLAPDGVPVDPVFEAAGELVRRERTGPLFARD